MKSLRDAIQLRAQIWGIWKRRIRNANLADRRSALTFVVAGGGFTGVETVAALNDFVVKHSISTQDCVKICCELCWYIPVQ